MALDVAIVLTSLLSAWIAITGGWTGRVLGIPLAMQTLFTPVLVLTTLATWRVLLAIRPRVTIQNRPAAVRLLRLSPYAALACGLLMSPVLYALGRRVIEGRYVSTPVFWRTSMPGVDLASFFVPNPNHPWFSAWSHEWLTHQNGGYVENVASVPLVALLVVGLAAWQLRGRLPRYWVALALLGVGIAVGPFLRVAGVFTYIPTPWTLLRYAPVLSSARAPARFMVVVMAAVSVLFALALRALGDRWPRHRPVILGCVAAALLFELVPAPRTLHTAEIPSVYAHVAADPRPVRVLEIPFGVRDGLSSFGNFTAASQYYQTFHHKRLIGGYLSRVSHHRVDAIRRRPVLEALMALSEGRPVPDENLPMLRTIAPTFIRQARVGYVVVDRVRATDELIRFAVETLDLELVASSPGRELYRPRVRAGFPGDLDAER